VGVADRDLQLAAIAVQRFLRAGSDVEVRVRFARPAQRTLAIETLGRLLGSGLGQTAASVLAPLEGDGEIVGILQPD
jgi:translation initiation factor IF-3